MSSITMAQNPRASRQEKYNQLSNKLKTTLQGLKN
jgi:hypothetical protein